MQKSELLVGEDRAGFQFGAYPKSVGQGIAPSELKRPFGLIILSQEITWSFIQRSVNSILATGRKLESNALSQQGSHHSVKLRQDSPYLVLCHEPWG